VSAVVFDVRNEVRRHVAHPRGGRPFRRILVPAVAYRVVAPAGRDDAGLDVFERAILGLCDAGVVEIPRQADLLCLQPALVSLIVEHLRNDRRLDGYGRLTEHGRKGLLAGREPLGEPVEGTVYRDALSGTIYPRFMQDAPWILEGRADSDGGLRILEATEGRPERWRAVPAVAPGEAPSLGPPTAAQVLQAVDRDREAGRGADTEPVESATQDAPPPERLSRVTLIDPAGTPVWLLTVVYKEEERSVDWLARDPFTMTPSGNLRSRLEGLRETRPALDAALRELEELGGPNVLDVRDMDRRLRRQARDRLRDRCGAWAADYEGIEEELAAGEVSIQHGGASLKYAVLSAYKALEGVFKALDRDWPPVRRSRERARDKLAIGQALQEAAEEAGFALPEKTLRVMVEGLLGRPVIALRDLLGRALLAAIDSGDHPLHAAAAAWPTILDDIDEVVDLRNQYAHFDERRRQRVVTDGDAEKILALAERAFVALLGPHSKVEAPA